MATTMFTSIALSISSLSLSKGSYPGTFKVLIITNSISSSGQGIFILAIFGIDTRTNVGTLVRNFFDRILALSGMTWNDMQTV